MKFKEAASNMRNFIAIFMILSVCEVIDSKNILAIIPSPYYSHQATFRPLWRELAKRGHKLTLITTDLMEHNENITQIDFSKAYKIYENQQEILQQKHGLIELFNIFVELVDELVDYQFGHPDIVNLIKNEKKFDLMIAEWLLPVFPILSKKFQCPYIGVTTMDAVPILHSLVGNADHPAIYPFPGFAYIPPLSFRERLISTSFMVTFYLIGSTTLSPFVDKHARKYFGDDLPDLIDVYRNVSLIFTNANPVFYPIRPLTPITVNLEGGLHLTKPQKLPKDLQNYLDQAVDGCIYFSFGTTVNLGYVTKDTLEIFRKTFEDLAPVKVLWKFENDTLANKPKNVELRKWLPQQDVLRHPNVKVFITQGGLQSLEEGINAAVPMLGIPFYGEQITNVKYMVIKNFGLQLDVETLDQTSLKECILELMRNKTYQENIQKLSNISKDKPMNALEKAVWWTEYVLRHGGTEHLRSPSADIPLYQYFFLDIIAFVAVVFIFIILFFYYSIKIIRYVFRRIFRKLNKHKIA